MEEEMKFHFTKFKIIGEGREFYFSNLKFL